MIGVYNHLLGKVFSFHYHPQKVIESLGNITNYWKTYIHESVIVWGWFCWLLGWELTNSNGCAQGLVFFFGFACFLKFRNLILSCSQKIGKNFLQKKTPSFRPSLSKKNAHVEMRYSCYPTLPVKTPRQNSDPVWDPIRHKVGKGSAESELFEAEGGSPAPKPKPKVHLARLRLKWKGFHCPTCVVFRG